ncbi:MAG TPA: hypothetical protein VN461_19940 [Vicinamibacteria bacterium]|nr:hypothetical protein [Vicinamibacteria bacterium]
MEDLDHLLAALDSIEPSSGFAAGVVEALRREQREGPPLPFPWRRLGAGLSAAGALAFVGAILSSRAVVPWNALPASLQALSLAGPTLAEAAMATLLSFGLYRLPRAFSGD